MKIHIDIERMPYRVLGEFSTYMTQADLDKAFKVIHPYIAHWELDIPLDAEDVFGSMSIAQSGEVLRAISEAISEYVSRVQEEETGYVASLDKWNNRKALNFIAAVRSGNVEEVEAGLCEVITLNGAALPLPLIVRHALGGVRAFMNAYQKALSAKN